MRTFLFLFLLSVSALTNAQSFMMFAGDVNTVCDNLTPVVTTDNFENFTVSGIVNSESFMTSVNEIDVNDDLTIYPNPCYDILIVNTKTNDLIQIFDITGKTLVKTYEKNISVKNFNPGIYLLKTGNLTEKFIKN